MYRVGAPYIVITLLSRVVDSIQQHQPHLLALALTPQEPGPCVVQQLVQVPILTTHEDSTAGGRDSAGHQHVVSGRCVVRQGLQAES